MENKFYNKFDSNLKCPHRYVTPRFLVSHRGLKRTPQRYYIYWVLLTVCTVARLLKLCASTAAELLNVVRILIRYLLFTRVHKTFAKAIDRLVMSVHPFVCIPYGTALLTWD